MLPPSAFDPAELVAGHLGGCGFPHCKTEENLRSYNDARKNSPTPQFIILEAEIF
jgi:hypothetical protein